MENWSFFLDMLSVERTESYINQLRLPFRAEDFPSVMELTRACREFVFFSTVSQCYEKSSFYEVWTSYRNLGGVLSDDKLGEFSKRFEKIAPDSADLIIYTELSQDIGQRTAEALLKWYSRNFRPGGDPIIQLPGILLLATNDLSKKSNRSSGSRTDDVERDKIHKFCSEIRGKELSLELRFEALQEEAKREGPTVWEKVLQHYPPNENPLRYFPWLRDIRNSLQILMIRDEWANLRKELTSETISAIVDWVDQNKESLPMRIIVPEELKRPVLL